MNNTVVRWIECLFLLPLSVGIILRLAPQIPAQPQLAIFLLGELAAVALLLMQRRGATSLDFYPITLALIGTGAALLVAPIGKPIAPAAVSFALVMVGGLTSLSAKAFLGRSFGLVPANRGVKDTGVYRLVRHPMYAGYMLNQIGFLMAFFSPYNVAIYAVTWVALWLRTVEEEKFLTRDPAYRAYAERVRYRLLPGVA